MTAFAALGIGAALNAAASSSSASAQRRAQEQALQLYYQGQPGAAAMAYGPNYQTALRAFSPQLFGGQGGTGTGSTANATQNTQGPLTTQTFNQPINSQRPGFTGGDTPNRRTAGGGRPVAAMGTTAPPAQPLFDPANVDPFANDPNNPFNAQATLSQTFNDRGQQSLNRFNAETNTLNRGLDQYGTQERARINREADQATTAANRRAELQVGRMGVGAGSLLPAFQTRNSTAINQGRDDALGRLNDSAILQRTNLGAARSTQRAGLDTAFQDRSLGLAMDPINYQRQVFGGPQFNPSNTSQYFGGQSGTAGALGTFGNSAAALGGLAATNPQLFGGGAARGAAGSGYTSPVFYDDPNTRQPVGGNSWY